MRDVDRIIVHGAWTPPDMDIGVKEIEKWHLERGFNSIGYHAVIRRDGMFEFGRPVELIGAHASPWNRYSIGICLVGGKDGDGWANNYTPEQMDTLFHAISWWQAEFNVPDGLILGHCDVPTVDKACPGFDVQKWWRARRADS